MRKTIALIVLMCLFLTLTACDGNKEEGEKNVNSSDVSASQNAENENDVTEEEEIPEDEEEEEEFITPILSGTVNADKDFTGGKYANMFFDSQKGGYDKEAAALRESIRNTASTYNIKGKTYYISPYGDDFADGTSPETAWQTLDAIVLNSWAIEEGDAVLLERGYMYRASSTISLRSGVTYGAYGKGTKPIISGSLRDYASEALWNASSKKNIWKMEFAMKDAGIVVFNGGETYGIKKQGLATMNTNGDFYHNVEDKTIYLYCDKGNPGTVYGNMEIGTNEFIFTMNNKVGNITIDNLCFKYTGAHAIDGFENNHHITIKNCEFAWIGGSMQNTIVRYGNAIQFWDSCNDVTIENNWIYQIYDAGMTYQYKSDNPKAGSGQYKNIKFKKNLIEYCTYGIEIFTDPAQGTQENITIEDNVIRFSGYGFGSQRPNDINDAHICCWNNSYGDRVKNFTIKNNIFDCATTQIIYWMPSTDSTGVAHTGVTISGNTYFNKPYGKNAVVSYSDLGTLYASNQKDFEAAIAKFDSAPKKVQWINN